MAEKIKVDLGDTILVAEKGVDPNFKEISLYLEDKEGNFIQDVAMINSEEGLSATIVRVWSDPNDEDYTHKFIINNYKGEENE